LAWKNCFVSDEFGQLKIFLKLRFKHHEKFLNLWKNADSGRAELEDARERLARFK
jgi:hypothetical protein